MDLKAITATESCQTCRARRVKCDRVLPTCSPCQKSRRVCLPFEKCNSIIHLENDFASGRVKRPRGPRSQFRPPRAAIEHKALTYYKNECLLPKQISLGGGLSECVRAWQASGRSSTCVDLAISALALAAYSRTHDNDAEAAAEALMKYKLLLEKVQLEVKNMSVSARNDFDPLLLSSFVMGRLEGVILEHQTSAHVFAHDSKLAAFSHHDGVLALLKTWFDTRSEHPTTASAIVKFCRRGQLRSALLRQRPLPDWLHNGLQFGELGDDLIYDAALVSAVDLQARLLEMEQTPIEDWMKVHMVHIEIHNVLAKLEAWSDLLPRYVEHECDGLPVVPSLHFYSRSVIQCDNLADASKWAQCFALGMFVASLQFKALLLYGGDLPKSAKDRILDQPLMTRAVKLAALVPYFLQCFEVETGQATALPNHEPRPYAAGLIVFPLGMASVVKELSESFQNWLRTELQYAGQLIGDRMVSLETSAPLSLPREPENQILDLSACALSGGNPQS